MSGRRIAWALVIAVAAMGLGLGAYALGRRADAPVTEPAQTAATEPAATDLVIGPYVSGVSPEGARVHWVSPAGVQGSCRLLGPDEGAKVELQTAAIVGRSEIRHTAVITALKADQRHWYAVTAGSERAEGSFRTPPPQGSRRPFTFAVTGDTQTLTARIRTVQEAIADEAPAFVIHTGDLTNDGKNWPLWKADFYDPAQQLLRKAPIWPARGNHERGVEPMASLFALPAERLWHSFDYDNLHVVLLDQWDLLNDQPMESQRMEAMKTWLEADLAAARGRADWILVAGHQPMFNVAGHGSTWGREEILPILIKHGVDLVVGGHSHLYERFVPIGEPGRQPIQFLVAGGGGGYNYASRPSPILLKSYSAPHYCLYRVEGRRLELTVKGPDGCLIDRFVLTRTGEVPQNIAASAVPPEDALRLLKVFKILSAEFAGQPKAGQPLSCTIQSGVFPEGSQVRLSSDPSSAWAIEETTFQASDAAGAPVTVTPPPGLLLDEDLSFSPALSMAVELQYKGRSWSCSSVPLGLTEATVRRLTPQPEPVSVPPATAAVVVDGDLAEWKDVAPLRLPAAGGAPARSLKLAWTADALYGAVVVEQPGVHVDAKNPWNGDGLEVCIEPDAAGRLRMGALSVPAKFYLWPNLTADNGKPAYKRATGRFYREALQSAWRRTPTGYTLEFRIAARGLTVPPRGSDKNGVAPPYDTLPETPLGAGRKIGLDLILRRDGLIVEQFADVTAFRATGASPIYWGQVLLSGQ